MSTKVELIIAGDSKDAVRAIEAVERAEKKHAAGLADIDRAQARVESSAISVASAYGAVAGAMAGIAIGKLTSDLYNVNSEFDRLHASLVTITGSLPRANAAFAQLEDFATKTPYQLSEVVTAFSKLSALNLDASTSTLESYGNTASAMGKSLNDMIEAVADASTGEFERLKEFGIKAKSEGDKVVFTFRGVSTSVGKDADSIQQYLLKLGKTEFAGGMLRQMDTIGGAASNLADQYDKLLRQMGRELPIQGGIETATAALKLLTDNLDTATVGIAAFTATGTISGLSAMSGWLSRIGVAAAGLVAVKAALAGIVGMSAYLATKKVLSWGDDTFFGGDLGYGEKKLKDAQQRTEELRKLKEKNDAAAAAAMNVGPASLGAEALAKMREEQEKQIKAVLPLLDRYSRSLNDLGREQLRLAESGFSRDMQLQADYFNRTATAAGNLTAPIRSYLAVIDQVYGAQKRGQEAVLATMVQIGASDAARLQQQINLGTVEKTMLESRRKAWETYAGDVEKLVATAWDNIAKKEETLLQSRLATQGMKDTLRDKIDPKQEIDPFTARLQQQDALRALEQKAMASANPAEQLRLLEQAQKGWAALDSEVKIGEDILISTDTAARQALDNVDRLGKAIDTLRQQEATQAAEALQDLVMAKGEAEAAITALDKALLALDTRIAGMTRKIAVTGEDKTTPVVDDVKRALDTLKDKTITITANYVSNIPGVAGDASAATATQGAAKKSAAPVSPGKITGVTLSSSQPYSLPGRANGGPVSPFGTYVVGERGPEILQMGNQGGTVIPNEKIGGQTIQFGDVHFNLPNVTDQSTGENLARAAFPHLVRLMEQRLMRKTG